MIIPTLNRDDVLEQTLKDLLAQKGDVSYEILVVDQNPEPVVTRHNGLAKLLDDPRIRWIDCIGIGNVVYARNLACSQARGDLLVFVDDDVRIKDFVFLRKHMNAHAKGSQDISAVCGREINLGGADYVETLSYERTSPIEDILFFPRNYRRITEACVLSTCNCSITRTAFIAVAGFDERFRGASYGDDSDLALRLVERGYRIIYDPAPVLLHLMWPMGGLRLSDKVQRYRERDKYIASLLFYYKHISTDNRNYRWYYIKNYILRKSFLLRRNVVNPWRLPLVVVGLIIARKVVRKAIHSGHQFTFSGTRTR